MWQCVSGRVAHLHSLNNRISALYCTLPPIDIVSTYTVRPFKCHRHNSCNKSVACMFVVCTYSQIALRSLFCRRGSCTSISCQLIEPILPRNIVRHIFIRTECRKLQRQLMIFGRIKSQRKRTEIGLENIFFLSVKIDLETFCIVCRTKEVVCSVGVKR